MNTSLYIAKRYLFSKKSFQAINFISGISVLGVFVGSFALVVILSAFNGLEKVILSMYNTFTPELLIEPLEGKTFSPKILYLEKLKKDPRVLNYTEVLQEKALTRYDGGQFIGIVKGVGPNFSKGKKLDSTMVTGSFLLNSRGVDYAVIGAGVQNYLGVNPNDESRVLELLSPRKGYENSMNPADAFNVKFIRASGVFSVQKEFDDLVIVPLDFARELLGEANKVSAIELSIRKGDVGDIQDEIQSNLANTFIVKNRIQQDQGLYKTLNTEKFSIYIILTFVLIIAIFNIIGSLTMLVIDKRKDIAILSSIGASSKLIRNVFFIEGMMISMIGCISGMVAGLIFSLIQQHFGFIKMGEMNMVVEAYPIDVKWIDFLLVFTTVTLIASITSGISSRLSIKNLDDLKKDL